MSNNIEGKVVVITGASSGLGEATARHLSAQGASRRAGRAARRSHRVSGRRVERERRQGARRHDGRHRLRPGQAIGRRRRADLRAHRCDDQQRRADAAGAARASQDRRMGPDDRREHQGRAVRHRRGAAAYEAAEGRAFHQRVVRGRPQGRARLRGLCGDQICRARPLRRAAPGGEALQYPHDGHLAGRGGHGAAEQRRPIRTSPTSMRKFYDDVAIPADSFARAVAFAISQPEEVDINEILFRPTRQEL